MKTLTLSLLILLILPLAAEDQKPASFTLPVECKGSDTLEQCQAASASTALTTAENEQLALALMQAQAARLNLLEALKSKAAGFDEIEASDQATKAYAALLQFFAKQHAACAGAQWNFSSKSWMCAEPPK